MVKGPYWAGRAGKSCEIQGRPTAWGAGWELRWEPFVGRDALQKRERADPRCEWWGEGGQLLGPHLTPEERGEALPGDAELLAPAPILDEDAREVGMGPLYLAMAQDVWEHKGPVPCCGVLRATVGAKGPAHPRFVLFIQELEEDPES